MDFFKTLKESIDNVAAKKNQTQAVKQVVNYLKKNGFPPS